MYSLLRLYRIRSGGTPMRAGSSEEHREIVAAMRARDADGAERLMRAHVARARLSLGFGARTSRQSPAAPPGHGKAGAARHRPRVQSNKGEGFEGGTVAIRTEEGGGGICVLTLAGADGSGYPDDRGAAAAGGDLAARPRRRRPALRVVVVRGNDGMFCRGRIGAKGLTRASDVAEDLRAILQRERRAWTRCPSRWWRPIEGEALGFGFGLTAQSDYAVAAADAECSPCPRCRTGCRRLVVLSYLYRFVPYKRAFELAMSSRRIGAAEAKEAGVVTEVVRPGQAVARAMAVARAWPSTTPGPSR